MVAAMHIQNENDRTAFGLRTTELRNVAIGFAVAIALIMVAGQISDSGSASGSVLEDTADKRFTAGFVSVAATDDTYGIGESITITVTWDSAVSVTGVPTLALSNSDTATYFSGSGSTALSFLTTVAEGDSDSTDLSVSSYSGTITADNDNAAAGAASGDLGSVVVDGDTPDITGCTATDGDYGVGESFAITCTCLLYTSPSPRD